MPKVKRTLPLVMLSFPWIILDFGILGWWFRLTGAWVDEQLFSLLRFNVIREGTNIIIYGLPVSIGSVCSGINTLQSMLLAGIVVAFIKLGRTSR